MQYEQRAYVQYISRAGKPSIPPPNIAKYTRPLVAQTHVRWNSIDPHAVFKKKKDRKRRSNMKPTINASAWRPPKERERAAVHAKNDDGCRVSSITANEQYGNILQSAQSAIKLNPPL